MNPHFVEILKAFRDEEVEHLASEYIQPIPSAVHFDRPATPFSTAVNTIGRAVKKSWQTRQGE